jgi:PAS domain S-box-containing protein
MRANAAVMVKSHAANAAHYLVLTDFDGLEAYLLKSAGQPDLVRLQVCEPDGKLVGDVEHPAGGEPRARPGIASLPVPPPLAGAIFALDDTLVIWEPIEAGGTLGWVKATYTLASIRAAQAEAWKESLLLSLIWAVASAVLLLLVLRPVALAFGRLSAFARRLDDSRGELMDAGHRATEIEELGASLNYASGRIFSTEQQLIRERERLHVTLRSMHDGVIAADAGGAVVFMNRAGEELTGWTAAEATGRRIDEVLRMRPAAAHGAPGGGLRSDATGSGAVVELAEETVLTARGGRELPIAGSMTPILDDGGDATGTVVVFRDIAEQRQAERRLRLLAAIVQSSDDAIIGKDLDGTVTSWNRGAEHIYGYSESEMIGRPITALAPPELHDEAARLLQLIRAGEHVEHFETVRLRKDGTRRHVSITVSPIRDDEERVVAASTVARDITDHKRAEQRLTLLNFALNNVHEEAYLLDEEARFDYVNDETCRALGYSREELLGMNVADVDPDFPLHRWAEHWREIRERGALTFESRHRRKDGSVYPVEIGANYFEYDGRCYNLALARDISERKRAEAELARVNRALRMLSDANEALVRLADEAALLNEVCRVVVEIGGYRMAWVAYAEQDEARTLRPMAHAGEDSGYIESARLTWADNERGRGPGGRAVRTGKPSLVRDIQADPSFAPWRAEAARRGYRAVIGLPLVSEGRTFGVLGIYAAEVEAFEAEEVEILAELAGDLAFGITAQRTRTTRDRAESELKRSEEKYRTLIQKIRAAVVLHGADTRILTANSLAQELLGLTEEQLLGRSSVDPSWHCVRDDGTLMPVSEYPANQVLATRQALRNFIVGVHRPSDQELVWTLVNGDPVLGPDGAVEQIIVTFIDVTERKKAERALRESEQRYRQLLGSVTDYIYTVQIQGNRAVATVHGPGCANVTGYAPGEYANDPGLWYRMVYEPDRAAVTAQAARILAGDAATALEHRILHRDGSLRWVRSTPVPRYDEQGRLIAYDGLIADITERKCAEELLREREAFIRTILDSVDEGFIVVDREYRIVSANRAFCRLLGLPEEQVVGRHCYEVSHHAARPCFESGEVCPVKNTFESGGPHFVTHTHLGPSDAGLHVEIRTYPITDAAGKIVRAIETVSDVSKAKRLEDQLRQAQKMEAIGTLAGGVAHDFNNILTAIIGYGSIVQMKMKPDDPQQAALDQILQSADRAAHLTQGLLAFSRKQVIKPKPVDLNGIVKSVEKLLLRIIGEDIELSSRLAGSSLIAMADSGQIEQVLMNLATNARDAMPEGGALTIATEAVELDDDFAGAHALAKTGPYALIAVSDTGVGMDKQTRDKIFEPFFTTKTVGKGTGLGLAIVYGIVKQHDGTISVYSEPGKGTTFKIYLPLIAESTLERHAEAALRPQGGTETILLAEDDVVVRNLTTTILADFGYRVIQAVDGEDAIAQYASGSKAIDLLIVDVVMPKKSGREVLEAVKAVRPDAKMLFVSGYTADILHKKGIFEEGIEFLSKPISPFELLRKVRSMLDKRPATG